MTNREFSDSFDTLLNSYASQAMFGEEAAKTEIVLDEYEKSVLLTQAQDNIIKAYFQRHTNELGQGFDDSTRRQVDFSSLIKIANITSFSSADTYDNRGLVFKFPTVVANDGQEYSRVLYILNEALVRVGNTKTYDTKSVTIGGMTLTFTNKEDDIYTVNITVSTTSGQTATLVGTTLTIACGGTTTAAQLETAVAAAMGSKMEFDASGTFGTITETIEESVTLNGATTSTPSRRNEERYVVVPINYKEYDREMTKAYAQPLKKQAWRLFQNNTTQFDIYSEVIPIWNVDTENLVYKVRYVERPTPIVLVQLPNGLTIDGYTEEKSCTLNPILHPDILNEAVRLAIESRASAATRAEAYRNAEQRQNRG